MFKFLIIIVVISLLSRGLEGDDEVDDNQVIPVLPNPEKSSQEKDKFIKVGDMLLTNEQHDFLYANDSFRRHGLYRGFMHWPGGNIPVVISEEFDPEYVELIKSAMNTISNVSCVKFQITLIPPQEHYLKVVKQGGCSSLVGRVIGEENFQLLKVGDNCKIGNVVHELLHVLGLLHMQTAVLRDNYVRINWKNIHKGAVKNFDKFTAYVSMFDTEYDYRSIMHYSSKAFAINRKVRTIIPFEKVVEMGQRERLSAGDITRINRMYKCEDFSESGDYFMIPKSSSEGTFDNKFTEEITSPESALTEAFVIGPDTEHENNFEVDLQSHQQSGRDETNTVAYLRNTVEELMRSIQPLCAIQTKLVEFMRNI